MAEIKPTVHKLDVISRRGTLTVPFRVLFSTDGKHPNHQAADKYNTDGKPLVEFYDRRYPHTPDGQFVSRYYLETLLASGPSGGTFVLDGGVDDWCVDGETWAFLIAWLSRLAALEISA